MVVSETQQGLNRCANNDTGISTCFEAFARALHGAREQSTIRQNAILCESESPRRACGGRHPVVVGEWLSLVEHLVRDQGVGGSNPLSPTNILQ